MLRLKLNHVSKRGYWCTMPLDWYMLHAIFHINMNMFLLCFVLLECIIIGYSCELFPIFFRVAIIWLSQYQWSNPKECGLKQSISCTKFLGCSVNFLWISLWTMLSSTLPEISILSTYKQKYHQSSKMYKNEITKQLMLWEEIKNLQSFDVLGIWLWKPYVFSVLLLPL